jgi:hypothetical protein
MLHEGKTRKMAIIEFYRKMPLARVKSCVGHKAVAVNDAHIDACHRYQIAPNVSRSA